MRSVLMNGLLMLAALCLSPVAEAKDPAPLELLQSSKRVLFLGDSITAAGQYVAYFETWLQLQPLSQRPEIIDAGLPSETVSGLSEEGHAGGKFPRPDLAERLDRVLAKTHPDLVFACYGMNCGIYLPFSEERFEKYQAGIRQLKQKVEQAGAKLILITPPFYDDQVAKRTESYNAVLDRYSTWLLEQREQGWMVIDLHGPMAALIRERRKTHPDFTVQPDAVHPSDEGHWLIAQQLIRWAGGEEDSRAQTPQVMLEHHQAPEELLNLVRQRMQILRDAYVSAAGHLRPGVVPGLPVDKAEQKAHELTARIEELTPKSAK